MSCRVAEHSVLYEANVNRSNKASSRTDSSAPGRNRTCDKRFRKPLLYPLSYEGGGSWQLYQGRADVEGARSGSCLGSNKDTLRNASLLAAYPDNGLPAAIAAAAELRPFVINAALRHAIVARVVRDGQ